MIAGRFHGSCHGPPGTKHQEPGVKNQEPRTPMPLFSIVTVTLDPPPGDLRKTVESVLAQGFDDLELLLKDGGSKTDLFGLLPEDPRIRLVVESDTGIFDAMNQALERVRGDYVCFLNAGDAFYDETALAAVAEVAEREPEVELLYGDVAKPLSRSGFEIYPPRLTRRYVFSHTVCHQAWFVKSSYYRRPERYDTKHAVGGDPAFLLRMILENQVVNRKIARVIVSYAGGGISQKAEHVAANRKRLWALKKNLYGPFEYRWLRWRVFLRDACKPLIYDTWAWRLLKRFRSDQVRRQKKEA